MEDDETTDSQDEYQEPVGSDGEDLPQWQQPASDSDNHPPDEGGYGFGV